MFKQAKGLMVALLVLCLAGCGSVQPAPTVSPYPSNIQEVCEQVVLGFTEGEPVEFVEKVDETNGELGDQHFGFYVFEDKTYQYIVDPNEIYICRIHLIDDSVWRDIGESEDVTCLKTDARDLAVGVFNKVMSKYMMEGSRVEADCPDSSSYTFTVNEMLNGIPTGNSAGISISKNGILEGGVFQLGDPENIDKLINEQNKMISVETAQQIALEEVKAKLGLDAENIQFDDSEPCEMMTLGDATVWAVRFTYTSKTQPNSPIAYGALVMVEVFSGEVLRFYLS